MQVEKWVIYGILSLILLIAAFNMIGALTMLVLEKQKDIAVLKAMGASDKLIQQIFLSEGFLLAGIGCSIGMAVAFTHLLFYKSEFKIIPLEGGTFIIDYYPVRMILPDFLLVAATVFVVALLAAWVPSRKAATQFFSFKELRRLVLSTVAAVQASRWVWRSGRLVVNKLFSKLLIKGHHIS